MNDDFLYRIRAEPPPHFIVSLKERLNQLENVPTLRRRAPLPRNFFVGSLIAGAVLATGLFVSRTMYSPPADGVQPMPTANPAPVHEKLPGLGASGNRLYETRGCDHISR